MTFGSAFGNGVGVGVTDVATTVGLGAAVAVPSLSPVLHRLIPADHPDRFTLTDAVAGQLEGALHMQTASRLAERAGTTRLASSFWRATANAFWLPPTGSDDIDARIKGQYADARERALEAALRIVDAEEIVDAEDEPSKKSAPAQSRFPEISLDLDRRVKVEVQQVSSSRRAEESDSPWRVPERLKLVAQVFVDDPIPPLSAERQEVFAQVGILFSGSLLRLAGENPLALRRAIGEVATASEMIPSLIPLVLWDVLTDGGRERRRNGVTTLFAVRTTGGSLGGIPLKRLLPPSFSSEMGVRLMGGFVHGPLVSLSPSSFSG